VRDAMVIKAGSAIATVGSCLRIASGMLPGDFIAATFFELGEMTSGSFTDGHRSINGIGKEGIESEMVAADIKAALPHLATNDVVAAAGHRFGFAIRKPPRGPTLTRFAPNAADRDAVRAAARAVVGSDALADDLKIGASLPPSFNAEERNGVQTLTGSVEDERAHEEILTAVRRQLFDATLVDKLGYRPGAPQDFAAAVSGMRAQLSRLGSGAGTRSDTEVSLKGVALYAKAASEIPEVSCGRLPKGYAAVASLGVEPSAATVEAAAWQPLLTSILDQRLFDLGEATIQTDSAAALDRLAAIAMRCPDARIEVSGLEVSGPADPVSDARVNIDLSWRRAEAVANYLVEAGTDSGRPKAVGYGNLGPIASNDNRAQSLRIEFRVK